MQTDPEMLELLHSAADDDDAVLARTHAPVIRFDAVEPFLPLAAGCTVFRGTAPSPSFPRVIELPEGTTLVIEYAIWWDWDIDHLYELEHVWVYLDAEGKLTAADASWHGGWNAMALQDGALMLYSEPGKHAFAPSVSPLLERRGTTEASCTSHGKTRGLLVTPLFKDVIPPANPSEQQLICTYLEQQRFQPSYEFSKTFALTDARLVPWPHLYAWIPLRVRWWIDRLSATKYV